DPVNRAGARHKCARGDDHLVTRTDSKGFERELEGHCAVGHRDCVLHAAERRKLLLELPALLTCPVIHLARAKHLGDGSNVVVVETWPRRQGIQSDALGWNDGHDNAFKVSTRRWSLVAGSRPIIQSAPQGATG